MRFQSSSNFWIGLAVLLIAGGSTRAAPQHCPAQLQVAQHAINVPAGLKAFETETQHNWVAVQFSDGAPDEQAWLAPDAARKTGRMLTASWTFAPGAAGIWLSCGYTGTSVVASFRLPDTVRACEVRYDQAFSPPSATAIDCR